MKRKQGAISLSKLSSFSIHRRFAWLLPLPRDLIPGGKK